MKGNKTIQGILIFLIFVCIICFAIGYLKKNLSNDVPNNNTNNNTNNNVEEEDIDNKYTDSFYVKFNEVKRYESSTDVNSNFIKEMYALIPDNSFVNNSYSKLPSSDLEKAKSSSVYQNKLVKASDLNKFVLLNATVKEIMMKYYRYLTLNENVTSDDFLRANGSEAISLSSIRNTAIKSTYKELFNLDIDEGIFTLDQDSLYLCINNSTSGGYIFSSEDEEMIGSDMAVVVTGISNNIGLTKVDYNEENKEYYLFNKNNNVEYKHTFKVREDNTYYYVSTEPVK